MALFDEIGHIVAEFQGKVIGHALLDPMGLQSISHIVRLTIVVHPNETGKGVGKAMLQHLIEWAQKAEGVEKIELLVRSSNRHAIYLYKDFGFEEEGRLRNRIKINNETYIDDISMGLFPKQKRTRVTVDPGMLAFFPWIQTQEPIEIGNLQLIPFDTEDKEHFPEIVDKVLEPYRHSGGGRSNTATLIKYKNKNLTDLLDEEARADIFNMTEILAFSALADRKYFSHGGYLNKDHFACVAQGFSGRSGGAAVTARRRDGENLSYFPPEVYEVRCPAHVSIGAVSLKTELTEALLRAYNSPKWEKYDEAIRSYNRANTDSNQTIEQLESVSAVGAFERLYQFEWADENKLSRSVNESFSTISLPASQPCERLKENTFYKQGRPIREIWLRDFYQCRKDFAHGGTTPKKKTIWSLKEHLLLSAYLFPLLVKVELQRDGFYKLTDNDLKSIFTFDSLACCKSLFLTTKNEDDEPDKFPWQEVMSKSRWDWIRVNLK